MYDYFFNPNLFELSMSIYLLGAMCLFLAWQIYVMRKEIIRLKRKD